MVLGASQSSLDNSERIRVASVYEEREGELSLGSGKVMGWKGGWQQFVGLGSQSSYLSGDSKTKLKKDLVLKTV